MENKMLTDAPPAIEYTSPAPENTPLDEKIVHSGGVATFSISTIAFVDVQVTSDQSTSSDDQSADEDDEIDTTDVSPYDVVFLFEETEQDMHWGETFPGRARRNLAAFYAAEVDYHGCVEADLAQYERPSVSLN
jgi:hypothetical protein